MNNEIKDIIIDTNIKTNEIMKINSENIINGMKDIIKSLLNKNEIQNEVKYQCLKCEDNFKTKNELKEHNIKKT